MYCADHTVSTPSYGNLKVDIGFGGGFFGFLPLADVGLTPESSLLEIKKAGTEVKNAVKEQVSLVVKQLHRLCETAISVTGRLVQLLSTRYRCERSGFRFQGWSNH